MRSQSRSQSPGRRAPRWECAASWIALAPILRRLLLRRSLLCRRLDRLAATAFFHRQTGTRGQQFNRRRHRDALDLRALRDRRVRGPIGHVRTVAPVENFYVGARFRVLAEILQLLRLLPCTADRLLRLRQQLLGTLERDGVDVI